MAEWYIINNTEKIDSPALVLYPDRIEENIGLAVKTVKDIAGLRPHVKTNKTAEVCRMMTQAGIKKFKCATIAEAEMLAMEGAPDVLLAYQPAGPKTERLLRLQKAYPGTLFSCLVDNEGSAQQISELALQNGCTINVFIDLNVGMNRTGISAEKAPALAQKLKQLNGIRLKGVHAYDGHIHEESLEVRQAESDAAYRKARKAMDEIELSHGSRLTLIIGGTPTFSIHARRENCECSPGTFVFWDRGYGKMIGELPFRYAALLLTRVISVVDEQHVCVDLGYKAVAAESPLPRVHFLNAPSALPVAHSEEHLVLGVTDSKEFPIGRVLYGVPVHICPTVALYDKAQVISGNRYTEDWNIIARKRVINY